jgi:acyl-CoA thioester hydrolase
VFEKTLFAGWGDMDFNSHMRNTAYLDKSADVRMMFFSENGFAMSEFVKRGIGPVIFRDELLYFKEVRLLQPLRVTLAIAGLAGDGGRWSMRNEFHRDATLVARVTSEGGWLDLGARRLTAPPPELLAALRSLPRTDDFQALPPTMR